MYNKNMNLIVGLGNPEKKYEKTPHNIGFKVLDTFQERYNFPEFEIDEDAQVSKKGNTILIKPLTYMNNSGLAVKKIARYYKIPTENVLVVQDEIYVPLGEIKESVDKTSAGHKGIQSIIDQLGSKNFSRIRIGINTDNNEKDLTEIVLKPLKKQEQEILNEAIEDALVAIDEFIKNNI
jgi:PTH1 family peptidyl-tRNA hydrolase